MPGLFGINEPRLLYKRLLCRLSIFTEHPIEEGIFDVIFLLCHLREWICPGGSDTYKHILEAERSPEQKLHAKLHTLQEYIVVRDLCNNAKHFADRSPAREMEVFVGTRAGFMRVGDRLDVMHLIVDGCEVREYFDVVVEEYYSYFKE